MFIRESVLLLNKVCSRNCKMQSFASWNKSEVLLKSKEVSAQVKNCENINFQLSCIHCKWKTNVNSKSSSYSFRTKRIFLLTDLFLFAMRFDWTIVQKSSWSYYSAIIETQWTINQTRYFLSINKSNWIMTIESEAVPWMVLQLYFFYHIRIKNASFAKLVEGKLTIYWSQVNKNQINWIELNEKCNGYDATSVIWNVSFTIVQIFE